MEKKLQMRIILKNGADFIIECDKFATKNNGYGELKEICYSGVSKNMPMFIDLKEVAAILQVEVCTNE